MYVLLWCCGVNASHRIRRYGTTPLHGGARQILKLFKKKIPKFTIVINSKDRLTSNKSLTSPSNTLLPYVTLGTPQRESLRQFNGVAWHVRSCLYRWAKTLIIWIRLPGNSISSCLFSLYATHQYTRPTTLAICTSRRIVVAETSSNWTCRLDLVAECRQTDNEAEN